MATKKPKKKTVVSKVKPAASKLKKKGLIHRVKHHVTQVESHKTLLTLWATLSVLLGFGMVLPDYVAEYNLGSTEVIYVLLMNAMFNGFVMSLAWFLPIFGGVILYCLYRRFQKKDWKRPFLTQALQTKMWISAAVAAVFSILVYLDASNVMTGGILKPPYCPNKLVGEVCLLSGVLAEFVVSVFFVVFITTLVALIALWGFYKGVSPMLDVNGKRK